MDAASKLFFKCSVVYKTNRFVFAICLAMYYTFWHFAILHIALKSWNVEFGKDKAFETTRMNS